MTCTRSTTITDSCGGSGSSKLVLAVLAAAALRSFMLTLVIKLKMKMSYARRLSARKSKQQSRLARTQSSFIDRTRDDGAASSSLNSRRVVRKINMDRSGSGGGGGGGGGHVTTVNLDGTSSSDTAATGGESALEVEFEAIEHNWTRFVGFPMQVLLLVGGARVSLFIPVLLQREVYTPFESHAAVCHVRC